MSRCFPYPPPGYCRNGATYEALIESIKLQKETDKAKAERKIKKKAKKEKKQKEKRKDEEKGKIHNNPTDSHKVQNTVVSKEAINKQTGPTNELLEKSDLTEDHGQPVGYSSDSTQNSNKRKRDDDVILPDGSPNHGKQIKIRLLKKHKGPDSNKDSLDSLLPSTSISINTTSVSNPTTPGVTPTSRQENNTVHRPKTKNHDLNNIQTYPKNEIPNFQLNKPEVHIPPRSKISDVEQPPIPTYKKPILTRTHETPGPSSIVPCAPSFVPRKIQSLANNDPTRFENPGPTRFEKKMRKKHLKYEKVIGSWVAPVLETRLPDDDDDWFLRRGKTVKSSSSRDDVETCRESVTSMLWQPCVRFLAVADIHVLPYTVPF